MNRKSFSFYVLTGACLFCNSVVFSQKNKEKSLDSTLEATSEKWKVKEHKGIAGIAKPEFGPYTTLVAEKLDSPVIKKKTKDSSGAEISYSDAGWDLIKYQTVEKKKFYRMVLGRDQDTIELQFYIHSVSAERKQTVLGKMLSKNDKGTGATRNYQKNIEGIILLGIESIQAHFFIEDYVSSRQIEHNNPQQNNPTTHGYILIGKDSLFTEPVMQTFGNPKSNFFMQWQKGIFMNDINGTHIALLQFGSDQPYGDEKFYIRIRRDIDGNRQDAIAAFFAAIIGVKDL